MKPFEDKYVPVPESGCWLWTSGWDTDGYGLMTGNVKAHRFSYQQSVGPIPRGMFVCHKCDTPACVNPAHLFIGTPKENSTDRNTKGRQSRGSNHHHAKLTEAQVVDILASTRSRRQLAAQYGVTHGAIGSIRAGRSWCAVTGRSVV